MSTSILHEIVENATNIAPSTRERYARDLNAWIEFAGDDPSKWTRQRAQKFYAGLLKRMKPQSANRLTASIEFAAKWWAIQEDNPELNFAVVMKAKSGEKSDKIALTEQQARCLLDNCDRTPTGLRDFAMIVLGLETGMRRMSLRSMTIEHTFLDGDARTGYPTARVLMKGHGDDRVFVPISDTAITALRPWLTWLDRKRGPIFVGLARTALDQPHKPSLKPLGESSIHKLIAEHGARCNVHMSPHVFRHTFVTWRLAAGYKPHDISAITAHELPELAAMGEYLNRAQIGSSIRNSTPEWLAAYVARRVSAWRSHWRSLTATAR